MENFEDFNSYGFDEREVKREAKRFETMLKRDELYFFDLITLEEIYYYY